MLIVYLVYLVLAYLGIGFTLCVILRIINRIVDENILEYVPSICELDEEEQYASLLWLWIIVMPFVLLFLISMLLIYLGAGITFLTIKVINKLIK